jgi:type IV secretory pathway protease TraF
MFLLKPLVVRLLWLLIVPLNLLAVGVSPVRLNISPSLPYGFYRMHAVASSVTREMLVVVHLWRLAWESLTLRHRCGYLCDGATRARLSHHGCPVEPR